MFGVPKPKVDSHLWRVSQATKWLSPLFRHYGETPARALVVQHACPSSGMGAQLSHRRVNAHGIINRLRNKYTRRHNVIRSPHNNSPSLIRPRPKRIAELAILRPASAHQREERRAGILETIARSERRPGRANAAIGRKTRDVERRD